MREAFATLAHAQLRAALRSANPPTVLIVDDIPEMGQLFATICSHHGYRAMIATAGEEGIDKARALQPEAILMDVCLPGLSGWDALRVLKSDVRTLDIPVIMVTGFPVSEEEERRSAAASVLRKPCGADEVIKAVSLALHPPH